MTSPRMTVLMTTLCAGIAVLSCGAGPALAQSSIKVLVNGEPITSNEIGDRARFLRLVNKTMGAGELQKVAMDELVDEKLKLGEAKRVGIEVKEDQVDAAYGRIAAGMKITPAVLSQALQQQGVNPKTLKQRIRTQMIWQRMVMGRFNRQVSIGEAEIADALQKKGGENGAPAPSLNSVAQGSTTEYTLQQITLVVPKTPAGMGAQRLKEAEALRAKVTTCDQLIDAARGYRETVVKPMGKRTEDELPPQFKDVIASTPDGHLSKPVPTAGAVEMVAVCGKREIKGDFSVRSKVEDELRQQEGALMARRYLTELRRIAVITYK